ncbi:MAG: prepilin-type N-terminal cleavage/methylation domain-containing protein [Candidatus Omnitrophota bacterium]|nr:prepilin-type N-terminal cleavage/methylation domain-containing protein [Candidatus Omnitrophota bacterium]
MTKKFVRGFSLVEIMIAVVIVGIILAIALPNYFKSGKTSQRTVCVANLEKIDAAIDQWALENHASAGTAISGSEDEIYSTYVRGGKPRCASGGVYTLFTVGAKPQVTCSKEDEGHKLP